MAKKEQLSTRGAFGEAILALGTKYENVFALSADLRESMRLIEFQKKFPKRYIECGVAEQNMMGIASGIAMTGGVPFATSFSVFNPMRNYDQVRVSVCLSNIPVKIVGGHGGFSNYKDGASHQSFEDIAITRVLPNMKVFVPVDAAQVFEMLEVLYKDPYPNYIRISATENSNISKKLGPFEIGKMQIYNEGKDLAVFSYGDSFHRVRDALSLLKVHATLVNVSSIKPIDKDCIIEIAKLKKRIVVVEDHQIVGGLFSAVSEVISTEGIKCKILPIGMDNTFGRSSRTLSELYKYYGLDADSIAERIDLFLSEE